MHKDDTFFVTYSLLFCSLKPFGKCSMMYKFFHFKLHPYWQGRQNYSVGVASPARVFILFIEVVQIRLFWKNSFGSVTFAWPISRMYEVFVPWKKQYFREIIGLTLITIKPRWSDVFLGPFDPWSTGHLSGVGSFSGFSGFLDHFNAELKSLPMSVIWMSSTTYRPMPRLYPAEQLKHRPGAMSNFGQVDLSIYMAEPRPALGQIPGDRSEIDGRLTDVWPAVGYKSRRQRTES